jgi:hypothetical protein
VQEKEDGNKEKVNIQFGEHNSFLEKHSSGTCTFIAKRRESLAI